MHMYKFIKIHMLNMCNFLYKEYLNKTKKKEHCLSWATKYKDYCFFNIGNKNLAYRISLGQGDSSYGLLDVNLLMI